MPLILAIESSCDETAVALVRGVAGERAEVLASGISSQIALHREHGGVVPELASRNHSLHLRGLVEKALAEAGVMMGEVDAFAATTGPGLASSLLIGSTAAKAMACALHKPFLGINHLEGHLLSPFIGRTVVPAHLALIVSGGHTLLLDVAGAGAYRRLGGTRDDAAGEAFDKGARLLGLGYPGGPAVERAAVGGDPTRFDLPRAWLGDRHDFSFSGLKTALARLVEPYRLPAPEPVEPVPGSPSGPFREHRPTPLRADLPVSDLAAAFELAIVEPLAVKTARAAREFGARTVLLAGGVAANRALRDRLAAEVAATCGPDVPVRFPPLAYCTDNAAMIAGAAHWVLRRGDQAGWEADVAPRLELAPA